MCAGKYSVAGATVCTPCSPGSYQTAKAMSSCNLAPVGSYVPLSGETDLDPASAGFFIATLGATVGTATPCPVGSYSNAGASVCTVCSAGKYNAKEGQKQCSSCEGGYFANLASSACTPAPPGSFVNSSIFGYASLIPAGYYGSSTGMSNCCNFKAPVGYVLVHVCVYTSMGSTGVAGTNASIMSRRGSRDNIYICI